MTACSSTKSTSSDVTTMTRELVAGLNPRFGFIACTEGVQVEALRAGLAKALPGVPFVGVTSCRSVIANGDVLRGPIAATAFWLSGDGVSAAVVSTGDATDAAGEALAKKARQLLGAEASFALFHGTPGTEEALLRGLSKELATAPLLGGSAADDAIAGKWTVFTQERALKAGAALALVKWPGEFSANWVSGAMPAGQKGVVTRAEGRTIHEIDGKPAAEVYDGWLGGALRGAIASGEQILGSTTLTPLGVHRASGFTLVHPERIVGGKSINSFATINEGETVSLMKSTKLAMQGRPANLVSRAQPKLDGKPLKGVLLFYCAGCMLTIEPDTQPMLDALKTTAGKVPIGGAFNFGEQGCHERGAPDHGNLMTGLLMLT